METGSHLQTRIADTDFRGRRGVPTLSRERSYASFRRRGPEIHSQVLGHRPHAPASPTQHDGTTRGEGGDAAAFFEDLFLLGGAAPGDSGTAMDTRPNWVDDEKLSLGQRFAEKYFVGLMLAEISSLCIFMPVGDTLQALIFTGNSDTPAKAFRRYLSTVKRLSVWYSSDIWGERSEARRQLQTVRQMHAHYRRQLTEASPDERMRKTTLQPPLLQGGTAEALREDLGVIASGGGRTFTFKTHRRQEWINQMEMSATQLAFVGLMVTHPEGFGAAGASEEELEGFVHLWRVLGHLIGLEDRFNFCAGGLEAVRMRSRLAVHWFAVPALAQADASWEHMSRCAVEGVRLFLPNMVTYEVLLVYALETVGVAVPRLKASLSAAELLQLHTLTLLLRWVERVPPLRALLTWRLKRRIAGAQKISPERLRAKEARVYSRQRAAGGPGSPSAFTFLPLAFPLLALAVVGGCSLHFLPWVLIAGAASALAVTVCLARSRV